MRWICVLVALSPLTVLAEDIHVGPGELAGAMSSAGSGDTIFLAEGDYGDIEVSGSGFVIAAEDGQTPRVRTLTVRNAEGVTVRGLSISLSYGDPYASDTMVSVQGSAPDTTIESCDIFSVTDETQAGWSADDWANLPGTGMSSRAERVTFRNNRVRNVGYGISIAHDSPEAQVIGNLVENFSRDGLRGIGDYGLFENNTVKNAYDVDDHHDDFFQSWSVGEDGSPGSGVVVGVVIRGNTFINFDDPDQPFAGAAQGIGCFDGFFEDWVIENNVVQVNHWHGITLLGARNVRVVNNTVIDNRLGERPGPPWIDVSAHKDGTESSGIVIRNNLVQSITLDATDSVQDHNFQFDDPSAIFVDVEGHDFHLLDGASDAIDQGSDELAPSHDRDGIPRPQGSAPDLGAYEWHDGTVMPDDAGGGLPDAGPRTDSGMPGTDGGPRTDSGDGSDAGMSSGGGGCSAAGSSSSGLFLLLVWLARRRR